MEHPKTSSLQTSFWRDHQTLLAEITFVIVAAVWGITFVFFKNASFQFWLF
jgi:hypothetical protein